jgi:AcrR family transcriptional regulator
MGRPASADARDTRRVILDAALDLFAERGYHATSVRALARTVGVRESALYHHFPSKEAILEAVIADRAASRAAIADRELRTLGDRTLGEVLTSIGQALLAHVESPREKKFLRLALSVHDLISTEGFPLRRITEGARHVFRQLVVAMQRSGRLRRDVDMEVFMIEFLAPLLFASGALWGGGKGPIHVPAKRFLKAHVAALVRAFGAP